MPPPAAAWVRIPDMKVGLVLGAGGIQGGAWLTGGLDALAAETGWDPAEADYVVGTSAGSMIGALCASGVPPWFMVAHSRGEVFEGVVDADGRPAAEADRAGGARFQLERALPPIGPGSWRLALRTLANPTALHARHRVHRLAPARDLLHRAAQGARSAASCPSGWSPHPNLWVVACDYADRPARAVRPRRRSRGRARRRRRRLLRDPGHLPPADDRRAPLRGRRHLLDLEPRPAARPASSTS